MACEGVYSIAVQRAVVVLLLCWEYYKKNAESVHRIMRFDVLRMQWWLPRWLLQIPYDIMNRLNRRKLYSANRSLTEGIAMEDYSVVDVHDKCFDLFYIATK